MKFNQRLHFNFAPIKSPIKIFRCPLYVCSFAQSSYISQYIKYIIISQSIFSLYINVTVQFVIELSQLAIIIKYTMLMHSLTIISLIT